MTDLATADRSAMEATVRLAATGDEAAFASLVTAHHASMMRVAYVIAGDADLARDAVQSAWTIAWRRLGSLRDPGTVRSWLVAIAANEARQSVRRERRAQVVDVSDELSGPVSGDPAQAIGVVDLERALRRLKTDERALLALRYVGGLDSAEIAAQVGLSASGVRSRLARLLDRLRLDLDHD